MSALPPKSDINAVAVSHFYVNYLIPLNCWERYDVLTTGATASACAKMLLKGGAAAVDVLTLARVVRAVG